ncbi:hypothetical protein BGX27_008270 [Mortierella sp. AM989]|nr:hypothetical protein BGX27_008270 [Mortierella sp. AM989]
MTLRSPLRGISSSKTNNGFDPLQSKHYSPAPNLILQPSPILDKGPGYDSGKRSRTFTAPDCYQSSSGSTLAKRSMVSMIGPKASPYDHVPNCMVDSLPLPTASISTTPPISDVNHPTIIDSPNSAPNPTPNFNGNQTILHNNPANISTETLASTSYTPTYPTHHEKLLLIDQQYNVMLNGSHIDFLSKLPYEIATYILHFVDMHNLTKVALISKTWKQFSDDNEVWKRVYLYQKQWTIRIPQHPPKSLLAKDISPATSSKSSQQKASQSIKPLNWKSLCRNRKQLEERWSTLPQKKNKLHGHTDSVYCVQFDHSKIITGSRDQTIKFWDLQTLECTHTLKGHTQSVLCLQFNENIMVSGSSDNTIIVWNMNTYQPVMCLRGHTAGVLDVCFDDQYIISCSKDTTIKVWDVQTGVLMRTMQGHRGPVNAVQLHKGQVVSASGDGMVKLWNVTTGQCLRDYIGHERGLACVQFDGETIVSGSNDKTIRIWDAATGRCRSVLTGHSGLVRTLHFEKNRIVSGSYDHSVKVWDMTTGQCTLDLSNNGHSSWVFDVQFSTSRIISTSQDKTIIVWDFSDDLDVRMFD